MSSRCGSRESGPGVCSSCWDLRIVGYSEQALVVAGAFLILLALQRQSFLSRPDLLETARRQVAQIEALAPRTPRECRVWTFVAITAGCCEEVLFRGFLFAFVASLGGLVAAVVVSVLLFGGFHAYYGWRGILRTASFGLLLTLMAFWSASLIPIIIHAAVDLTGGDLAYRVLTKSGHGTLGNLPK